MHNSPFTTSADRSTITAVQREIVAVMRGGRQLSHAHKEGGTKIGWERGRFVIEDYGDWSSRREFTDESAFLEALWKRYDWMVSPGRGAQRQTELETWQFILHELRREHFTNMAAASKTWSRFQKVRMIAALLVLVLAAVGFGVARLLQVRTIGSPFGQSVRVGDTLATLVRTQERYIPSLHRNPDRDRFRIDLMLTSLTGDAKPRMLSLARSLQRNAFQPGTKLLGTDGPVLWMLVPELKGVDLRTQRVITEQDLRAKNPGMGELWHSASYFFTDRLHLTSPDRVQHYVIEAETLRAVRDEETPRFYGLPSIETAATMQCLGGNTADTEFLGVLSAKERESSFRAGSFLSANLSAERTRDPRSLVRVRFDPAGSRMRIAAVDPVSEQTFADAAFIRASRSDGPLLLEGPRGFLMTYREGSILAPRMALARVSTNGTLIWTLDTGLREITQILPDATHPVFVGTLPAAENKVPEPVLVLIDTATGKATTRSLRP